MRKWTRRGSFKVATLTLLCGALVGASCRSGSTKTPLQAPAFPTLASLKPQELKLEKSNLVLGGTKIGVEVESKLSPGVCEIILSAYDQVMETEKYTFDEKSFGVREITGEVYEPSLDLIRFPLRIGDSYKWKGKLSIGEMSRPAEAIVQTGADKLFLEQKDYEAVKVTVKLFLESGRPQPAERQLTFWFVPGHGMLRREFGAASSRVPPGM